MNILLELPEVVICQGTKLFHGSQRKAACNYELTVGWCTGARTVAEQYARFDLDNNVGAKPILFTLIARKDLVFRQLPVGFGMPYLSHYAWFKEKRLPLSSDMDNYHQFLLKLVSEHYQQFGDHGILTHYDPSKPLDSEFLAVIESGFFDVHSEQIPERDLSECVDPAFMEPTESYT